MFRIPRVVVAALGLTLCGVSFAQSAEGGKEELAQGQWRKESGENSASPLGIPIRIVEEPEKAQDAQRQQKESSQREVEDLLAQQSMAKATEEIVVWTRLQFLLAFFGTGALIYSLHLNRKATNAAVAASEAARDAIGVERAWVTHLFPHYGNVADSRVIIPTPEGQVEKYIKSGLIFRIAWQNSGRSPALGVIYYGVHRIIGVDDAIPAFEAHFNELGNAGAVLPTGLPTAHYSAVLDDHEAAKFRAQQVGVVLYAKAAYFDVFSGKSRDMTKVRYSEICWRAVHHGGTIRDGDGREVEAISFDFVGEQCNAN
jgi:hypothetical protein